MGEQGAAIVKLMEKLSALSAVNSPLDPERGRTFDLWLKRYQDLFENELDERDKTRLLVSCIDEDFHQRLTAVTSPKQPLELSWNEILEVMERQFGSAKTLHLRRFECFKMRYEGQEFNNCELQVKTKCANAKLDAMDFDGLQYPVYVAGFPEPEFADYRTRLLRKLDQSEKVTLIRSYKGDSQMLESDPSVNLFAVRGHFEAKRSMCREMSQTRSNILLTRRNQTNEVDRLPTTAAVSNVIAVLKKDDHPHLDVFINSQPTQLLFRLGNNGNFCT
ncbi:unnamed protein product [Heligmosomoides polygyrus]|uniref:DUF7083 domain-containing protein n=1 Tax=Heligmosomoides polygyrus TaxID=6339 RepID=A0A183FXX0_HELPZ|nr:unnamed protein product [Heligmosomoides polygyrus]